MDTIFSTTFGPLVIHLVPKFNQEVDQEKHTVKFLLRIWAANIRWRSDNSSIRQVFHKNGGQTDVVYTALKRNGFK